MLHFLSRSPSHSFFLCFTLLFAGCSTMGLQSPQTFSDKLAYAYGVHTSVLETTTLAVEGGTLNRAEATQVLKLADQARELLDSAKVINAKDGDIATAQGKLTLAVQVLGQLQIYLKNHPKGAST